MAEADSRKLCSLPPNYVTIAQLQECWLKEKQREQQEKEKEEEKKSSMARKIFCNQTGQEEGKKGSGVHKAFCDQTGKKQEEKVGSSGHKASRVHAGSSEGQKEGGGEEKGSLVHKAPRVYTVKGQKQEEENNPVRQNQENHQNRHSKVPVGKNLRKDKNQSGNVWREITKEPKLKGVQVTAQVVEEGVVVTKKKKVYFGNRKFRAKEEIVTVDSVEKGGSELSKGKNQVNNEDEEVKELARPVIHRVSNSMPFASGISRLSKNKEVEEKSNVSLESGISRLTKNEEVKEVGFVCMVEVVGENYVDGEIAVHRSKVGSRVKKDRRRIAEQSGQENNVEKEVVSADVKERTKQKVRVIGAFRKYGRRRRRDVTGDVANVPNVDMAEEEITTVVSLGNGGEELSKGVNQLKSKNKEINEVGSIYMVEVVGENKVDKKIPTQRSTVGFKGKQGSRRMTGIKVGEVVDKADSVEQSQQEEVVVSDNVKERANEMERVRGGDGYGDKKGDVSLVVSEVNMKFEHNFGNLSLSNRRYSYGSSSNRRYGDKRRYGNSRRYEPQRMPNRRDSSFVWMKKGESSDGNIAKIGTQVDSSSQSTGQSQLCSQ